MGQAKGKWSSGLLPPTDPAPISTEPGKRRYILYDDTTAEKIRVSFPVPATWGSSLILVLYLAVKNTQTGIKNAGFSARLDARTGNTDAVDLETDDFDSDNDFSHALANNQAAGLLRKEEFALANVDSMVAGDLVTLELERDVGVADNASGDIEVLEDFSLKWTDA